MPWFEARTTGVAARASLFRGLGAKDPIVIEERLEAVGSKPQSSERCRYKIRKTHEEKIPTAKSGG